MATTPAPAFSVDDAAAAAKADPITSQNSEPGFANTYGPGASNAGSVLGAAVPALGVGGLGLLLLYRRHLQEQRDKEKELQQTKRANIAAQIPGAHPKDMLLGAALGGGAGLVYDAVKGQPEGKRVSTTLKRLLAGAGIGAVGGNFIGDRARRYVANTYVPVGYGAQSLRPRSWQHFWDAAVADRRSYDPKLVAELKSKLPADVAAAMLDARYELARRSFNVHRDDAAKDIWQRNKGQKGPDYLSLNEQNPEYKNLLYKLFLPSNPALAGGKKLAPIFSNPVGSFASLNANNGWRRSDLLGSNTLIGEQQIALREPSSADVAIPGAVADRFDITPEKSDNKRFFSALTSGDIVRPSWHRAQANTDASSYYGASQTTNNAWLKSFLGRVLWDKWLTDEHPWVSQKFQFVPRDNAYALQFQNNQGKPVSPPIDAATLENYLASPE